MTERRYPELWDEQWLRREHIDNEKTLGEMAVELGCDYSTVAKAIHRFEISRGKRSFGVCFPRLQDEQWLREKAEQGLTQAQIAQSVGCAGATVGIALLGQFNSTDAKSP